MSQEYHFINPLARCHSSKLAMLAVLIMLDGPVVLAALILLAALVVLAAAEELVSFA